MAAAPCTDADFDDFRDALKRTGVSASKLLEDAEAKLERRKAKGGGGS